jgi:hypothetical protein
MSHGWKKSSIIVTLMLSVLFAFFGGLVWGTLTACKTTSGATTCDPATFWGAFGVAFIIGIIVWFIVLSIIWAILRVIMHAAHGRF